MANLLIFDADYVSELTSRMNTACELMAEAVSSLRSAQNHENWKCKERVTILENFDELNLKLGRLDTGVNETTRILGGSVSRFAALEQQYESQAEGLSDELTSNYGFRASVTHGGSSDSSGGAASGTGTPGSPSAGQAGAESSGSTSSGSDAGARGSHGHGGRGSGAGAAVGIAGRIPGMGRQNHESRQNPEGTGTAGTGGGLGGTMNVNLPVTHIPDNPDAAARGIKDTREIAQIAVHSVATTMTEILSGGTRISSSSRTEINFTAAAPTLAEAYNAGRTIFENSSAIMASPAQPHTTERLAMAAGLVSLAGSVSSFTSESVSSFTTSFTASSSISQNAGSMIQALEGNSEAGEFSSILGALAENSSISGSAVSGSSDGSFFDMILNHLKNAASGGPNTSGNTLQSIFSAASVSSSSSVSVSAASSPVMEFLGTFVMDQAV